MSSGSASGWKGSLVVAGNVLHKNMASSKACCFVEGFWLVHLCRLAIAIAVACTCSMVVPSVTRKEMVASV